MYERLSAQDNSFLVAEQPNVPLHVTAVGIFEVGELGTEDGGVDIRKIKRATEAQLHRIPRYRQKLDWIPIENRPVWVDDPHFNLDYHIRHTALPRPGGIDELKRLTARISTQTLDRSRPLWEIWIIEGLEGNRFAMVTKVHHCMIDGVSGTDIAQILYSASPSYDIKEPMPYMPRPTPGRDELLLDAVKRRFGLPLRALSGLKAVARETPDLGGELRTRAKAIGDLLGWVMTPASGTPINGSLGPHRNVDWLTLPLDDVKALKRSLGCTLNDVVLATVTGAVRHYLMRRNVNPDEIDFRVSAPVSVRSEEEKGTLGNRVSAWIVRLPVDESRPEAWVSRIHEATRELKASNQALGVEMIMQAAEYLPSSLMALGARAASGPMNMIVTNVPGPPFPLYLLGAKMLELHPLVPLLDGTGLGIALFSYDGRLHIGLNADSELVPDLGSFTALFAQSYLAMLDAARIQVLDPEAPKAQVEVQAPAPEKEKEKEPPKRSRPASAQLGGGSALSA
jgi:WS/DGAT/MGAT family acyltransferase